MRKDSKTLDKYPQRFFEVAERAQKQEPIEAIELPDEKAAITTRHDFNRFRRALTLNSHPHAAAANDLIVRIELKRVLVFLPRGLWVPGEEHADVVVPGLEEGRAPESQRLEDKLPIPQARDASATEDVVARFVGGATPSVSNAEHEHEWNEYDVCSVCGRPKGAQ